MDVIQKLSTGYHYIKNGWAIFKRARQWDESDWEVLRDNSIEYMQMMDLAFQNNVYTQVLHNGHIGIELILKAVISKQYGKHKTGHDIKKLVKIVVGGSKIRHQVNTDPRMIVSFQKIFSAWLMQYRYLPKSVSQSEAQNYLIAFKEAYKWVKRNYSI